jgi:hypothetical protein
MVIRKDINLKHKNMATPLNDNAEKIKNEIKGAAEKSKETVKEIIDSSSKLMKNAIDSNKRIIDSIREKLEQQEIEDTVTDKVKNTLGKSIELAEDTIDNVVDSFKKHMDLNVDFHTKLTDAVVDIVKETKDAKPEKLLNLIPEHFEAARQLAVRNVKEMVDSYNKNANIALNFSQKFGESINAQVDALFHVHRKGLEMFSEFVSGKGTKKEKEVHH